MALVNIPGVGLVNFPDSMSDAEIVKAIENDILPKYGPKKETPSAITAGGRGLARGLGELGITFGDLLPAWGASALGMEEEAQKQLKEAEESRAKLEKKYPKAVESYKDVTFGTALPYVAERLGEAIPSIASVLIPGGIGGVAGRAVGTAAARGLAKEAAEKAVSSAAAKGAMAGAGVASYAQQAPEVFESVYRETGQMAPGTALGFGAVASALDAYLPVGVLSKLGKFGSYKAAEKSLADAGKLEAAKLVAKEAAVAAAKEGLTEAAQESITIAAEQFEGSNKKFFDPNNIERIIEAGISGAVAGAPLGAGTKYVERRRDISAKEAEDAQEQLRKVEAYQAQKQKEAAQAQAQPEAAPPEVRPQVQPEAAPTAVEEAQAPAVAPEAPASQAVEPTAEVKAEAVAPEAAPEAAPLPTTLDLETLKAQVPAAAKGPRLASLNSIANKVADKDLSDPVQRKEVLDIIDGKMQGLSGAKNVYRDQLEALSKRIEESYGPATDRAVQPEAGQPPSVAGVGAPVRPAEEPPVGRPEGVGAGGVGVAEGVAARDVGRPPAGEVAVEGFTTAKGSTYELTPEGKTVRTKRSPGEGQGTTYPPHDVLYVDSAVSADILSDMQSGALTPKKYAVRLGYIKDNKFKHVTDTSTIPDGASPAVAVIDRNKNKIVSLHNAQRDPAVGLSPVEKLYQKDGTGSTHIGNKIISLKTKAPTPVTAAPAAPAVPPTQPAPVQAAPSAAAPAPTTTRAAPITPEAKADLISAYPEANRKRLGEEVKRAVSAPSSYVTQTALLGKKKFVDHISGIEYVFKNLPFYVGDMLRGDILMRNARKAYSLAVTSFHTGPLVFENGTLVVTDGPAPAKARQMLIDAAKASGENVENNLKLFDAYMKARRDRALIAKYAEDQANADLVLSDPASTPDQKATAKKLKDKPLVRSGLTDDQIQNALNLDVDYPQFAQAAQIWQEYNAAMVRVYLQAGLITADKAEDWLNNVGYVPFYRVMDEDTKPGHIPSLTGAMAGLPTFKKLKGSERQVNDVFENMLANTMFATSIAARNMASRVSINTLQALGLARLANEGEKGNVKVYEDGNVVEYVIDDDSLSILQAFEGVDANIPEFIRLIGAPTRLLSRTITLNPFFQFRQLFKEVFNIWGLTGHRGAPALFDTLSTYGRSLANGPTPSQLALMRRGAVSTIDYTGTDEDIRRALRADATSPSWFGNLIAALEKNAILADSAARAQVYERALAEGDTEAVAAFKASQTIDYTARGSSNVVSIARQFIPFINPQIQSMRMLYQAATAKGGMTREQRARIQMKFYQRGLAVAALTSMYAIAMSDDEEYLAIKDEARDNFWFVPGVGPNGESLQIPIPFEFGLIFKALAERLTLLALGQDTTGQVKESLWRSMKRMFLVNPIPQGMLPFVETTTNYSFNRDRPIVGEYLSKKEPAAQYSYLTSDTARALGALTNISPMKIDHLVQAYFSQIGAVALMLTDAIVGTMGDPAPEKPTKNLAQLPVFNMFLRSADDTAEQEGFYKLREKVESAVQTFNKYKKEDVEKAFAYREEKKNLLMLAPAINAIERQIQTLRDRESAILASKKMSGDEKRDALNEIKKLRNQVASRRRDLEEKAGLR